MPGGVDEFDSADGQLKDGRDYHCALMDDRIKLFS